MLASVTHILPATTIRRERILPIPGRVVVRSGQNVNPSDVIAEANLTPKHMVLDVGRGLGLQADETEEYFQREPGEKVMEGDIIAGPVGLARRVVRAPRSGRVILLRRGQVLLEVESHPFELKAGMPGVVVSLISDRGAVIESTGALIQAVWGNRHIDFGLLHVLADKPEDILTADQMDVSMRGSVILGGFCSEADVFRTASELPVRGLILSSMASSLIPVATKMKYPIIVVEGFGLLPMNSKAFNLLSTSDRRDVALNAEPFDRFYSRRPEVIIPLPTTEKPTEPRETVVISPEQEVRVVRAPYKSQIGTVVVLRPGMSLLANKVRAPAAEISLESGENVLLPLSNLEVII